jgi:hypothetical protein
MSVEPQVKPVILPMRLNFLIGSTLPFLAGLSLFIGTSDTASTGAWTIKSEISAAALGAAYWAGFAIVFLAGFERVWAKARIAFSVAFLFTCLGFVSTAIDLGLYHTDSGSIGTKLLTFLWLLPYAAGPILMGALLYFQRRAPGGDPPRETELPGWLRPVVALQGAALVLVGIALFIAPVDVSDAIWPWKMAALAGRVMGAWLLALGFGAGLVLRENDWARSRGACITYALFGVLEIVVLLRYSDAVDFGDVRTLVYLVFLAGVVAVGGYGILESSRTRGAPRARATARA